jgi:hypothetical protein
MKRHWLFIGCLLAFSVSVFAQQEQNGLQVEVSRKTMARNDVRTGYYDEQRINRTMALHVTVKNVSMKPFPAGEIDYSLLVLKVNYFPSHYLLYSGTEALHALQIGESADVVIGAAEVNGFRDIGTQRKDKMDYKVVIKHGNTQTAQLASNEGFDAIAASAEKVPSGHN